MRSSWAGIFTVLPQGRSCDCNVKSLLLLLAISIPPFILYRQKKLLKQRKNKNLYLYCIHGSLHNSRTIWLSRMDNGSGHSRPQNRRIETSADSHDNMQSPTVSQPTEPARWSVRVAADSSTPIDLHMSQAEADNWQNTTNRRTTTRLLDAEYWKAKAQELAQKNKNLLILWSQPRPEQAIVCRQ